MTDPAASVARRAERLVVTPDTPAEEIERMKLAWLKAAITEAEHAAERGEVAELDDDLMNRLLAEAMAGRKVPCLSKHQAAWVTARS